VTPMAWAKWAAKLVSLAVLLGVLYVAVTFVQVWWASRQDDRPSADAIVVMGAAQWDGTPSPVLQARLDQAATLFADGVAPLVIVTGGKQEGDRFTEAFTSYDDLKRQGVPEAALRLEVEGTDTYAELAAASVILGDEGVGTDVVVVTDPTHALRSQLIADEVGLSADVSPTDLAPTMQTLARETAAVSIGRIVGFRRLSNWLG